MSSEVPRAQLASVSPAEFRHACGRFATGVTIASALDNRGIAHGLTVSSFTSVSLAPPLILICLGHEATMIDVFRRAFHFGISILREGDHALSQRFATPGQDRFEGVAWCRGQTGVPLIDCALAALECKVHQRLTAGDHDLLVGRVLCTRVEDGAPLIHHAGRYRRLVSD
jgi:flavin reductase (DIM6/NTAB) family NADH-FMN oxidoreductase RutF